MHTHAQVYIGTQPTVYRPAGQPARCVCMPMWPQADRARGQVAWVGVCSHGLPDCPGPVPCLFPGVYRGPVEEHKQSHNEPHEKALTQQLVSILLHLQRRPRNENPMSMLVGVNKYAIKMRKSKLWTGLFSCPLISFITEILLLNNISVNNLSSVFRSARVNNSITGGGSPLPGRRAGSSIQAKGWSRGTFITIPS